MQQTPRDRRFAVAGGVTLTHAADIALDADEQVTFTTPAGGELDVVRKDWGFYATSSLNGRLPAHGLRPALVRNAEGRRWLLLVERGHEAAFDAYRAEQGLEVETWLDAD
jgi:hypothetical protein